MNDFGIMIPNVITPNGDDQNQYFKIVEEIPSQWHLRIFNRYGKLIFESEDYQQDWDGGNVPDGAYFFHLKNKDDLKQYKGVINVIR